ncbi:MAG: response regulator transcription factor [Anaerolineales bacterium]|nr:response regulator transcription factor [Anaerolineales bacterium]
MAVTVLLADDHAVVRDGLRLLLEASGEFQVVGVAVDGIEAVRQALDLRPQVVVMDIAMPLMNGIEAAQQILETWPEARIVILSMYVSSEHVHRALQAGASGYLLKESAGAEVVEAVRTVAAGQRYLSRKITETVIDDYILSPHAENPLDSLSPRERQVLQLTAEGRSNAEMAGLLFLSPKTVETYRSRLMQKLDLEDIPALVKFAIQHGLISLD